VGTRILVVGAGVAGLSLARALRARGLEAELVERSVDWPVAGAGIYIPGNGLRALRQLGLGEEVEAAAAVVARRRLLDDSGRLLIDFDEAGLWHDVAPPLALHRRELHDILLRGAAGTPIRLGTTITAIVDRATEVHVELNDGSTGSYDLVVGADGTHSSVRTMVFGGPAPRLVGQAGWRFVVEGHPEIAGWKAWLGRDRGFLALAIGRDRVYGYVDVRSRDAADPTDGDPSRLVPLFASFAEPVPTILGQALRTAELYFAPVEEVNPLTWSKGRVVLVGDASHASSPNMAEGASMAMEDALVLAESLATNPDVPAALEAYRARRAERVGHVQATTHRRDRLRYRHPLVRRAIMGVAGHRVFRAHYHPLLAPP
jgi:2-polyprenyl-6-methoxyphenol hydroxylase-like FAD-dependent oxidoreductase